MLAIGIKESKNESKGIDPPLKFLAHVDPPFLVKNCKGEEKPFVEFDTWELLNLKPSTVLELPTRLTDEYSITAQFLQDALKPYLIQTVGKDYLERCFDVEKTSKFFVSTTKHYSWPKGGGKCHHHITLEDITVAMIMVLDQSLTLEYLQQSRALDPTISSMLQSMKMRAWISRPYEYT